ncbi:hypothetical protein J6590_005934 [Homalodisca vitripennis]|nr:hypothetical protein J6590_005934 [Homalodisca vitripennis]
MRRKPVSEDSVNYLPTLLWELQTQLTEVQWEKRVAAHCLLGHLHVHVPCRAGAGAECGRPIVIRLLCGGLPQSQALRLRPTIPSIVPLALTPVRLYLPFLQVLAQLREAQIDVLSLKFETSLLYSTHYVIT